MTTVYPGALDSYTTKVDGVDDVMAAHINDPQDAIEALEAHSQTMSLLKVKNTSGGTVAANDVGYIDEAGEFKTTGTAYSDVSWAVVIAGAANNAQIIVARRGRVTIALNGNCSIGDYLYISTTAKQAQPQSYMRPEIFAVALTANAAGAGGTCEALLLTGTTFRSLFPTPYLMRSVNHDSYDFVSTIATLPGGAVLTYGAVTSGDELTIIPTVTDQLAKPRLFNSTRSTYGLIDTVVAGTNTITLTANVDAGWQVGDTITARSQTCINPGAPPYFYDFDLSSADNTVIPKLARIIEMELEIQDSAPAAAVRDNFHPWIAYNAVQVRVGIPLVAGLYVTRKLNMPIFQQRFCLMAVASGAAAHIVGTKVNGYWEATP